MLIKGEGESRSKQSKPTPILKEYKILGVTCVHGNTGIDNVTKNVLRLLDATNRTDIPVFKGCGKPIIPSKFNYNAYFHGCDGFGDLEYEQDTSIECLQKKHAVIAMYEFACQYPNMVDYILVGPLTNFATCINLYGDEFLNKVRSIFVMGGNIRGKGNISKSAEFNFLMDPEAAYIVLENITKCKIPLLILPWETCIESDLGITLAWRLSVLGAVQSKAIELMNRVDRAIYVPKGFVNWIVCDAMLVASYLFPNLAIAESRDYHATVELNGTNTRGQMVLDHSKPENVTVVLKINKNNWRTIISWTAGIAGSNFEANTNNCI